MPVLIPRGPKPEQDEIFAAIVRQLERYATEHPAATVEAYRHGEYAVRVRITSPDFVGRSRTDRHNEVWAYFAPLTEDELGDLHVLVCVTPEERARSIASIDFDDPLPASGSLRLTAFGGSPANDSRLTPDPAQPSP